MKSDVLSVAAMLGLDLNNFNIEEVTSIQPPSYSVNGESQLYGLQAKSGLRFSPLSAATNDGAKISEEVLPGENPPKKKKGRKRKAPEVEPPAPVIPEISLTFDLGGDAPDKTINLQQLAQPKPAKRGRKKKSECQEIGISLQNGEQQHSTTAEEKNEKITFASPEEALESIEAADVAADNYSSDEENALVMDLSVSTGSI